ncbi:MAG: hypothetical protein GY774_02300 [Planctomycetes bacterium]|nr:hypothetical protein [Planctomycetota bacterium]
MKFAIQGASVCQLGNGNVILKFLAHFAPSSQSEQSVEQQADTQHTEVQPAETDKNQLTIEIKSILSD